MIRRINGIWYHEYKVNGVKKYEHAENEEEARELDNARISIIKQRKQDLEDIINMTADEKKEFLDKLMDNFDDYMDNRVNEEKDRSSATKIGIYDVHKQ